MPRDWKAMLAKSPNMDERKELKDRSLQERLSHNEPWYYSEGAVVAPHTMQERKNIKH